MAGRWSGSKCFWKKILSSNKHAWSAKRQMTSTVTPFHRWLFTFFTPVFQWFEEHSVFAGERVCAPQQQDDNDRRYMTPSVALFATICSFTHLERHAMLFTRTTTMESLLNAQHFFLETLHVRTCLWRFKLEGQVEEKLHWSQWYSFFVIPESFSIWYLWCTPVSINTTFFVPGSCGKKVNLGQYNCLSSCLATRCRCSSHSCDPTGCQIRTEINFQFRNVSPWYGV